MFSRKKRIFSLPTLALLLLVGGPLFFLFGYWGLAQGELLRHFWEYQISGLILNTLLLAALVSAGTFFLGVSLAWLAVNFDFPGKRILEKSVIFPIAFPSYVLAFVYLGLLDYSGTLQTILREWGIPIGTSAFRSIWGLAAILSLSLYPYLYLLARNAFSTQSKDQMDAARSLGAGPWRTFFKVSLPLALPWIFAGISLINMETMADFGAASIFNVDVFTTAIYKSWFGFRSLPTAAMLSSFLVLFVFVLLLFRQRTRSTASSNPENSAMSFLGIESRICSRRTSPLQGTLISIYFGAIWAFGFLVPTLQLVHWLTTTSKFSQTGMIWSATMSSFILAGIASLLAVTLALILVVSQKFRPTRMGRFNEPLGSVGYALPGSVLAVGVFLALTWLDRPLGALASFFSGETRMILTGTLAAVIVGYLIRYMALPLFSVGSAAQRVSRELDQAAASLGESFWHRVRRVHLPLLRGGIAAGAILVFVDVSKEMPLTLMTRPYGWDTLAVKVYQFTSEGEWERAALPATLILVLGMIPVMILLRTSFQNGQGDTRQT